MHSDYNRTTNTTAAKCVLDRFPYACVSLACQGYSGPSAGTTADKISGITLAQQ